MDKEKIQGKIIQILQNINEDLVCKGPDGLIDVDKSIELDSLNALKLIVAIENEFDIEIENINTEIIGSISKISNFISKKFAGL